MRGEREQTKTNDLGKFANRTRTPQHLWKTIETVKYKHSQNRSDGNLDQNRQKDVRKGCLFHFSVSPPSPITKEQQNNILCLSLTNLQAKIAQGGEETPTQIGTKKDTYTRQQAPPNLSRTQLKKGFMRISKGKNPCVVCFPLFFFCVDNGPDRKQLTKTKLKDRRCTRTEDGLTTTKTFELATSRKN